MASLYDDLQSIEDCASRTFGRIYARSNEPVVKLFNTVDVKNKDAFSVLASSDYGKHQFSIQNHLLCR